MRKNCYEFWSINFRETFEVILQRAKVDGKDKAIRAIEKTLQEIRRPPE